MQLSYRELLSSLDEFEGTTLDAMTLFFVVGWFRSLANIIAFMWSLPNVSQETTVKELREYILNTLLEANVLLTEQDVVD
jgi:hypothetical protein